MTLIAANDDAWTFEHGPALVAHRGFAAHYPENTLIALSAAVASGCRFLEFDVQLSGDGVPFLCHDDTLARTSRRTDNIFDLSWAEISEIAIGEPRRFGARFATVRPSALEDTVTHLNDWSGITTFVELKRHSIERYGAAVVVDTVWPLLTALRRPPVVISFNADAVTAARDAGAARIGWVIRHWNRESQALANSLQPDFLFCNHTKIAATDELWPGAWRWVIYEIATPELALRWRARGCDLIESMNVGELMRHAPFRSRDDDDLL